MKDRYRYPLQIRWNAPRGGIVGSREDGLDASGSPSHPADIRCDAASRQSGSTV
jgi:hypothetical protein